MYSFLGTKKFYLCRLKTGNVKKKKGGGMMRGSRR
jgi:hypothetical protein